MRSRRYKLFLWIAVIMLFAAVLFGCSSTRQTGYSSPTDEPDGDRYELVWTSPTTAGASGVFVVTDDAQYFLLQLNRPINLMLLEDVDLMSRPTRAGQFYPGYIQTRNHDRLSVDLKLLAQPKSSLHAVKSIARDITNW